MSWTTPDDVAAIWFSKEMLPTDTKIQAIIENMEGQIQHAYPKIQERIADNRITVSYIKSKVATFVVEFLQAGGNAYQQASQAYTGVAAVSYTYDRSSRKSLTLSAADLACFSDDTVGDVFSVSMAPDARVKGSDQPFNTPLAGYYTPNGWEFLLG